MTDTFKDIPEMLAVLQPSNPVYCVYPHVYRETAEEFLSGFPGRVLYAIKANNDPKVLHALVAAGITHFDWTMAQRAPRMESIVRRMSSSLAWVST